MVRVKAILTRLLPRSNTIPTKQANSAPEFDKRRPNRFFLPVKTPKNYRQFVSAIGPIPAKSCQTLSGRSTTPASGTCRRRCHTCHATCSEQRVRFAVNRPQERQLLALRPWRWPGISQSLSRVRSPPTLDRSRLNPRLSISIAVSHQTTTLRPCGSALKEARSTAVGSRYSIRVLAPPASAIQIDSGKVQIPSPAS